MAESSAARRILELLPGLYHVNRYPLVDPTFMGATGGSVFRPYLWDANDRFFRTEDRKVITLARAADGVVDESGGAVFGSALCIDPAAGEVFDHGVDVDADLGASWSLTFVIRCQWQKQPTASSAFYPFRYGGGSNPRIGYIENTGVIEAAGWIGRTTGDAISLSYALGWAPEALVAVTLVSDAVAGKTVLYVNGEQRDEHAEAAKANLTAKVRCNRTAAQAGTTGKSLLEAYFPHAKALTAAQVKDLHTMFTTGFTSDTRIVRCVSALAMAFAEVEHLAFTMSDHRRLNDATSGGLTQLGKDFKVERRAGESDAALRNRIWYRVLEYFSEATVGQIARVAAAATGLTAADIRLFQNKDIQGNTKHAFIAVQIPPGNEGKITDLDAAVSAAKAAGIAHTVGTAGDFAWGVAGKGWGVGSWNYTR